MGSANPCLPLPAPSLIVGPRPWSRRRHPALPCLPASPLHLMPQPQEPPPPAPHPEMVSPFLAASLLSSYAFMVAPATWPQNWLESPASCTPQSASSCSLQDFAASTNLGVALSVQFEACMLLLYQKMSFLEEKKLRVVEIGAISLFNSFRWLSVAFITKFLLCPGFIRSA